MRNFGIAIRGPALAFILLALLNAQGRGADLPSNLGLGLRNLVEAKAQPLAKRPAQTPASNALQSDEQSRVTVNIHLDGKREPAIVAQDLVDLGLEILFVDRTWRNGVISARLPLERAVEVSQLAGVKSVLLAPKPIHRAGRVTAESSVVDHANAVNARNAFESNGILGRGISVGIISDSYDAASGVPRASAGVASGDLPGTGNPDGYTQPVVVIDDNFAPSGGQTDEGRAMAEIVHDIAPAAKLAFSTVQQTQSIMAFSIRNLRANTAASCDIIVDDVFFLDEPFFSDGPLSLAVEDVVNGTSLPGKKVAYFSAAGNEANNGYASDLRLLTRARGLAANNAAGVPLDFSTVPPALYAGGFHNINATGPAAIAMPLTTPGFAILDFQWDDPFDANQVTTNYNLLIFDRRGNYVPGYSGTDDNFSTDEPLEIAAIDSTQTYYVVIALAAPTTGTPVATHLRFVCPTQEAISGPYISYEAASMTGHATALSANAVAAYIYNQAPMRDPDYNADQNNPPPAPYKPLLEDFTSNGGALPFYFKTTFNAAMNRYDTTRLATPEIRYKPDMAAADGVNTTFFGGDSDNDTFPNFFGTSAAAPTAAGVAALMLEAAGGPQRLTAAQIRSKLQSTAIPHDLDPFFCTARAQRDSTAVTVTAHGGASDDSANDPNFFTITFSGQTTDRLSQLEIDLTNAGLVFDESVTTGYPFTIGSNPNNIVVLHTLSQDRRLLRLTFTDYPPGAIISFGIDRDFEGTNGSGNSADLLAGARIRAVCNNTNVVVGAFANQLGSGFTIADGFGLIDARRAVESILGNLPPLAGVPVNVSTRGFIGTGDNALIAGVILQGSGNKKIIFRALGPSLTTRGVTGALQDPTLTLFDVNGNQIATNDNWQDDPSQAAQVQAAGFAPDDPRESALLSSLVPSSYTVVVRGIANTVGNGLVEAYDLDAQPANARLANVSTRGLVSPGDSILIGGFIVRTDSASIVARGLGPSLPTANALQDPILEITDTQGNSLAGNDNWQEPSGQAIDVQAAGLAPTRAAESAIAITLSPGAYTAILRGQNETSGVGLVEVYNLR